MAKLWDKGYDDDSLIDRFTVGRDRELDLFLAPYDIMGTAAHIRMLAKVGLLPGEDLSGLPVLDFTHTAPDLTTELRLRESETLARRRDWALLRAHGWSSG